MHPLTAERLSSGQYHTWMSKLRADSAKFFNYMRMSQETFDELFRLIEPHIEKKDTNMRCIPTLSVIFIICRYLATGCSFKDLHYTFQCETSTAQEIVFDVCEKIWQHLRDICIRELTEAEWLNMVAGGAIDGKHIKLIQPAGKWINIL
nr:unnamed protein product [Callosobruchus chinensis]